MLEQNDSDLSNNQHTDPSSINKPIKQHIIIVGAGFSGIGAAIKLKEKGFHDFIILEKENDLGGTWRDNTYPGLAVDIVSFVYSYSFEQNPNWSNVYAPGSEMKEYADHCAEKYDVKQHIRYGSDVERVVYNEKDNRWNIFLKTGEILNCQYFISACGLLVKPKMPEIPGIDCFKGKIIHSARWDHKHSLANEKVAVIGTGASAIQIVPQIAETVNSLDIYQRTPIWLLPKFDGKINERLKKVFQRIPLFQRLLRIIAFFITELTIGFGIVFYKYIPWLFKSIEKMALNNIKKQVKDPKIQKLLTPDYTFFCKRPSFSNTYYKVFNKNNVKLIVEPIKNITENGIITNDGKLRHTDTIICATGFSFFERGSMPTFEVIGKNGLNLADFWRENRFQSYEGATLPGLPNYFMIMGPYAVASASYFGMIDTQVHHLIRCLEEAKKRNSNYIEVKQSALDKNMERIFKKMNNTVFALGNCSTSNSYYFDNNGDAPMLRPVTYMEMWWKSRTFPLNDYIYLSK